MRQSLVLLRTFWNWMQGVVDNTLAEDRIQLAGWSGVGTLYEESEFIDDLPFAFRGGWVGHFTYEMKAESLPLYSTQSQPHTNNTNSSGDRVLGDESDEFPDANLIFANRSIVVRYLPGSGAEVYIQALVRPESTTTTNSSSSEFSWVEKHLGDEPEEANHWLSSTAQEINRAFKAFSQQQQSSKTLASSFEPEPKVAAVLDHIAEPVSALTYSEYLDAVEQSQAWIRAGESYEVCLTTQFRMDLH